MTHAFKVGDVCIWQNLTGPFAPLNGTETTIVSFGHGYCLQTGNFTGGAQTDTVWLGIKLGAMPHELRLKRPPSSDEATARQAMLDCIERARMGQGAHA